MSYKSSNREWLLNEIEAFFGNELEMDLNTWSTRDLEVMYDTLIGSMYNGIMIRD